MYQIVVSGKFKRDVMRCKRQQKDMDKFKSLIKLLVKGKALPLKNKNHNLFSNWSGFQECHIEPDWLMIYRVDVDEKTIELARMGSHSDLF